MIKFARKAAVISMLAAGVMAVTACGDKQVKSITENSSFEDKAAYAIGASVGTYLKKMQEEQNKFIDSPYDQAVVLKGFSDALQGSSALKQQEITETLRALDQKLKEVMMAKAQEKAKANLEAGEKFLNENKSKDGVKVTESGLQYKIITDGNGATPNEGDTVSVTYKGTTIDGKVFDEQQEAVDFPLDNMIPGWIEGLKLMTPGSEFEFYIPSKLAYGEAGAGETIEPNSVLIFNVKLIKVTPAQQPEAAQTEEQPAAEAQTEAAAE